VRGRQEGGRAGGVRGRVSGSSEQRKCEGVSLASGAHGSSALGQPESERERAGRRVRAGESEELGRLLLEEAGRMARM
jgi:hypothetical protein